MFADTISLDWAGSDVITMVRINQDKYSSEYRGKSATGEQLVLAIRHSTYLDKGRGIQVDRHNVELTFAAPPVDGYVKKLKTYMVLEADSTATADSQAVMTHALNAFTSDANVLRLALWES